MTQGLIGAYTDTKQQRETERCREREGQPSIITRHNKLPHLCLTLRLQVHACNSLVSVYKEAFEREGQTANTVDGLPKLKAHLVAMYSWENRDSISWQTCKQRRKDTKTHPLA